MKLIERRDCYLVTSEYLLKYILDSSHDIPSRCLAAINLLEALRNILTERRSKIQKPDEHILLFSKSTISSIVK